VYIKGKEKEEIMSEVQNDTATIFTFLDNKGLSRDEMKTLNAIDSLQKGAC
jgi:hypothetical protein